MTHTATTSMESPGWLDRLARRRVCALLERLSEGSVTIAEGDHERQFGDPANELHCRIAVHEPSFWGQIAFGGSVGAGEAYIQGAWTCDDLVALVRIMVINQSLLDSMERGPARLAIPALRFFHWRRNNTRSGSQANIAAHYDLGNDFFRQVLDPTLTYSSAFFTDRTQETLQDAQIAKLDRICRKLELQASDRVIEIGTGWGSFAIYAAQNYGCHVTTTTISEQQHDHVARQIVKAGLGERVTLLRKDYRDLEGRFDKLVSIEMIEAVGANHLNQYAAKLGRLLKRNGRALVQAITIADQRYKQALTEVDFIKRYVFPGSFIPSNTAIVNALTEASDLRLFDLEDMGASYALTLNRWRAQMHANSGVIRSLGYSDRLLRLWDFYLAYCEGGFIEQSISNVQLLLVKPHLDSVPRLLSRDGTERPQIR